MGYLHRQASNLCACHHVAVHSACGPYTGVFPGSLKQFTGLTGTRQLYCQVAATMTVK